MPGDDMHLICTCDVIYDGVRLVRYVLGMDG
jgi:hypothetical protein